MIKKVMQAIYAHRSNVKELLDNIPVSEAYRFKHLVSTYKYPYDILKYDKMKKTFTFITSPDWDTANEPIVGDVVTVYPDGTAKSRRNFKQIYHNKWQFVASNYQGFNIEKAKQRTLEWNSLPDIKSVKSKIGYKNFWEEYLNKHDMKL